MFKTPMTTRDGRRAAGGALALGALTLLAPDSADAHFILREPASSMSQSALGDPQKEPPCGGSSGRPTGTVTAVQAGQTITITINETIYHPGHYRVALAVNDRSELPEPPPVTAGASPCGSVPIQNPPVFPVLADGMLRHSRPFSGPQSFQVTLPADVTCDHCTLQIIEFMSDHALNVPGGCFYHHCADLSITRVTVDGGSPDDAGTPTDAPAALDAGTPIDASTARDVSSMTTPPDSNGCSCSTTGARPAGPGGLLGLAALAAWLRRSRRRG